jgi:hypothetical protein
MGSLRKTLSMSIVTAILLGITLLPGTSMAIHANAVAQTPPKQIINWKSVVAKANPYVHVVNGSATIDSRINQTLSQDEVVLVNQAVAKFNSLPSTFRLHPQLSGTSNLKNVQPNGSWGAFRWTLNVYWWGVRLWINSPAAQSFPYFWAVVGGTIGAAVGGLIGGVLGGAVGALIGSLPSGVVAIEDNYCGNRGIFIDVSWLTHVSITPVC